MSNFLCYRYRMNLKDEQKEEFDELYRCYVAVINQSIALISVNDGFGKRNIDLDFSLWNQKMSGLPETCYIRKRFSPLLHYIRNTVRYYERSRLQGRSVSKCKNPQSIVASIPFYPKDVNINFKRTSPKMAELNLLPFGAIQLQYHRPFPKDSHCILMTMKRELDKRYYLDFLLNNAYSTLLPKRNIELNDILGIDFSLKHFFVSTDDTIFANMQMIVPSRKKQKLIEIRRNNYIRSEDESKNKERKRMLYVESLRRIKENRRQYFYTLAHKIFEKYEAVAVETLELSKIKENKNYSKLIVKESYHQFEMILDEVAKKEGKRVIRIPKWYPSSKICSFCEAKKENLKVYEKEWICPNCKKIIQRDKNAAENIKRKAYEMIKKEK